MEYKKRIPQNTCRSRYQEKEKKIVSLEVTTKEVHMME
jgi:hypothetical protein